MSLIMKWAQTTAGLEVLKLAVSEHYFTRKLHANYHPTELRILCCVLSLPPTSHDKNLNTKFPVTKPPPPCSVVAL